MAEKAENWDKLERVMKLGYIGLLKLKDVDYMIRSCDKAFDARVISTGKTLAEALKAVPE